MELLQNKQKKYFQLLDQHEVECLTVDEDAVKVAGAVGYAHTFQGEGCDANMTASQQWARKLESCKKTLQLNLDVAPASKSFIVEAAIAALRTGLFTVPGQQELWNARQCLGFLLHAVMLQSLYHSKHNSVEKSNSPQQIMTSLASSPEDSNADQFSIFTGAAGTGKTTLLQACDVLTDVFFNSDGAVIKSAPTRTAARLNNGDTCHGA